MLSPVTGPSRPAHEAQSLRAAGRAAAAILRRALLSCRHGARSADVNAVVEREITRLGVEPLFLGYRQGNAPPFPGVCCVSINSEIVHGVPGAARMRSGDVVSVDVGLRLNGWCADVAASIVVPGAADSPGISQRRALVAATQRVLTESIERMRPGVSWSEIALAAENTALDAGFGIVTEFVGHGVGRQLHESPKVPMFWTGYQGEDFVLREGQVLAIEPILTLDAAGDWLRGTSPGPANRSRVVGGADHWTVRTASGKPACHAEHTVLVTPSGAEVLTA